MKRGFYIIFISLLFFNTEEAISQSEPEAHSFKDSIHNLWLEGSHTVDSLIYLAKYNWQVSNSDPSYYLYDYFDTMRHLASIQSNFILSIDYSIQLRKEGRALRAWERTENEILKREKLDTFIYVKTLNYHGEQLVFENKLFDARKKFLEIVDLLQEGQYLEEHAVAHNGIATIVKTQGDPEAAIPHYVRSLELFSEYLPEDHVYIGVINNNIGNAYGALGKYKKQLEHLDKGIEILKSQLGENHYRISRVLMDQAYANLYMGNRQTSYDLFEASKSMNLIVEHKMQTLQSLLGIAMLKSTFNNYYSFNEIKEAYDYAISQIAETDVGTNATMVKLYSEYSNYLYDVKKIEECLQNIKKGFEIRQGLEFDDLQNIPKVSFLKLPTITDLKMYERLGMINLAYTKEKNDSESINLTLECFEKGDSLAEILKSNILHGASREILKEPLSIYFKNKIEALITVYDISGEDTYLEKIFNTVEMSRNWDLIEKYFTTDNRYDVLNSELLNQIKSLKESLTIPTTKIDLDTNFDSLRQYREILYQRLKEAHPEYFQLLFGYHPASLTSLQSYCKENNSDYICYFEYGSHQLGILHINESSIKLSRIPTSISVIRTLKDSLINKIQNRTWDFQKESYKLYNHLLEPHKKSIDNSTVILAPNDLLFSLPFDILLSKEMSDSNTTEWHKHYAIQDYDFSYIPSATFLIASGKEQNQINDAVFFAPRTSDLTYNQFEVEVASAAIGGTVYTANIDQDLLYPSENNYDLFHFAGHTYTHNEDVDSIYMILSEGEDSVYLRELLQLNSNFDLAVLSSCHSAEGVVSGEGLRGLTFGFAFAGTPNILSSIWSVSDREAVDIHKHFYNNLQKGLNTITSINYAKRQYLEQAFAPAKHPFYWSNWAYNGHPLILKKQFSYWKFLIMGIIGFATILIIRKISVDRRN